MWDLFTVMLILWSAIVIPFSLAFRVQSAGLTVVAYVSDALFADLGDEAEAPSSQGT